MASSFSKLRAQQTDALEKLQKKAESTRSGGRNPQLDDETFLDVSHVRGKDGKGLIRGRFLPPVEGEDDPWVHWYEYQFQGPKGWYINKSRKTLGENERDPVFEYNGEIFADKSLSQEERKEKLLGRREFFCANFLVLKDKNKPENEGKVFKYKFGPQIFNIVNAAMNPPEPEEGDEEEKQEPFNPFDPFEGKDFILRVTTKQIKGKDVPSYETSGFAKEISSIVDNEEDFDEIWAKEYPLQPVLMDKIKPYDQLVREFNRAMGLEKKNIMDDDDYVPEKKQEQKTSKSQKKLSEELNDGIPGLDDDDQPPFDTDESASSAGSTDLDSNDDDDWFNQLKK